MTLRADTPRSEAPENASNSESQSPFGGAPTCSGSTPLASGSEPQSFVGAPPRCSRRDSSIRSKRQERKWLRATKSPGARTDMLLKSGDNNSKRSAESASGSEPQSSAGAPPTLLTAGTTDQNEAPERASGSEPQSPWAHRRAAAQRRRLSGGGSGRPPLRAGLPPR